MKWLHLGLVAVALVLMAVAWSVLPADQAVPIHWNLAGEPDQWANKWLAFALAPALQLAMLGIFALLPKMEPRKANYKASAMGNQVILTAILALFLALQCINLSVAMGWLQSVQGAVLLSISLLLLVLGNYLTKVRSNYFIGVRTPWTLSDDANWYKTHRLASKLMMAAGLVGLVCAFLPGALAFVLFIAAVMLAVLISVFYSWWLAR